MVGSRRYRSGFCIDGQVMHAFDASDRMLPLKPNPIIEKVENDMARYVAS